MRDVVPLKPVREAVEAAMALQEWSVEDERLMPLTRMWDADDFKKMFVRTDRETIPFDFADQTLCLLGLQFLWWDELSDIYYSVDLTPREKVRTVPKGHKRCEADGCANVFLPKRKDQKYCSTSCMKKQWWRDKYGSKSLTNKRMDQCPRGHDRSPENVRYEISKDGKKLLRCLVCKRE